MRKKSPSGSTPTLPEYADNPFIAGLPPPCPRRELLGHLAALPAFDEREREYPAHLRKHCIVRLIHYFEPLARQADLAERFDMLLRQGYVGRNPRTHDYIRHLQAGAERSEARSLDAPIRVPVRNTASAFALTGCSGVGKTKSVEQVLYLYPQLIEHDEPFSLIQIVWLRLEAPSQGSPKQLCINFFAAIDQLIGTNYLRRFGGRSTSTEQMLVWMAHVAQLHALGVLVVDEIQHLRQTKLGPQGLLNFLVTLVNTIGVPVVLIGTSAAVPILQGNFSQARRSSGLGSLNWERLHPDKSWEYFLKRLWRYQWTREPSAFTPELCAVLYEETQGIVDIAVKLFMLAQMRLVTLTEAGRKDPETLTGKLFRQVAREEFSIVQPMLDALRMNDRAKLARYDDLRPLQDHITRVINGAVSARSAVPVPVMPPTEAPQGEAPSVKAQLLASLKALGVAKDIAEVLVAETLAETPSGDPLLAMEAISKKLAAKPVPTQKSKTRRKPQDPESWPAEDLRRLVAEGKSNGQSAYEALKTAGIVCDPVHEFAA